MQKNKDWKGIFLVIAVLALLVVGYMAVTPNVTNEVPEGYVEDDGITQVDLDLKDGIISGLREELANLETPTVIEKIGHLLDELFLGVGLTEETFSDREVSTLFDGEVRFDGDNYDAEETIVLGDLELSANGNDFEGQVYLTIPEGAVEYTLTFEDDLDTSEITSDETLEFNLLGEAYEVSEWDSDTITLSRGTEQKLLVGESVTVDGKVVVLDAIADEKIFVCVDGVCKSISEDDFKVVNDVEIHVDSVFNSETSRFAYLTMGEDVETTIESGDEYEEDSAWEWVIDANSIGIVLDEDHTQVDLDGDEEFQAIGVGESLCLPNEYVCVQFNGISEEDTEEYDLRLDVRDGDDYVRIDGNFEEGTSDFDRVYVNVITFEIFDRDLELIHATEIGLGDTDSVLETNATGLFFEDLRIDWNLEGTSAGTDDEDFLTDYGVLVINPDDSIEDQEFNIFVPEQELEGSISLI